jgi:cytidylate kinase
MAARFISAEEYIASCDPSVRPVLEDIRKRDERDSHRSSAPLLAAEDAVMLDTSALDIEGAFAAALAIVMGKKP